MECERCGEPVKYATGQLCEDCDINRAFKGYDNNEMVPEYSKLPINGHVPNFNRPEGQRIGMQKTHG